MHLNAHIWSIVSAIVDVKLKVTIVQLQKFESKFHSSVMNLS
jgi:hypothetical protein